MKKIIITLDQNNQVINQETIGEINPFELLGILRFLEKKLWLNMVAGPKEEDLIDKKD